MASVHAISKTGLFAVQSLGYAFTQGLQKDIKTKRVCSAPGKVVSEQKGYKATRRQPATNNSVDSSLTVMVTHWGDIRAEPFVVPVP